MTRGDKRLLWISSCFLLLSITTRIGLALFSEGHFTVQEWGRFMGIGLVFDLTILPWFLFPWALYEAVRPDFAKHTSLRNWESRWAITWATLYLTLFTVIAAAEFTFWAEFGSRFDFIAIDYLVYTHEVIGNIREIYPVALWMTIILALTSGIAWISWPHSENIMELSARSGLILHCDQLTSS
jgi:hypothetical protein